MYQVIIVFHVLLGLGIIGLVLMQQGKGADAGAAFGSGSSGSVFGAQGATTFLSRTTAIFAVLFFSTSLGLAVYSGHKDAIRDFLDDDPDEIEIIEQPMADVPDIGDASAPIAAPPISDQQAAENVPAMDGIPESPSDEAVQQNLPNVDDVEIIIDEPNTQQNAGENRSE